MSTYVEQRLYPDVLQSFFNEKNSAGDFINQFWLEQDVDELKKLYELFGIGLEYLPPDGDNLRANVKKYIMFLIASQIANQKRDANMTASVAGVIASEWQSRYEGWREEADNLKEDMRRTDLIDPDNPPPDEDANKYTNKWVYG